MARAQEVVERTGAAGVKADAVTWNPLVHGWAKKGNMARAQEVVERTGAAGVKADVVTWNTLGRRRATWRARRRWWSARALRGSSRTR
jgi:hypothetical protein